MSWICQACNQNVESMGVLGLCEHGRCRGCGLMASRTGSVPDPIDPEDQILRDEEGLTPEELADGMAQFNDRFPIVTRPGESLIETVEAAREEDELFANDMKPRG